MASEPKTEDEKAAHEFREMIYKRTEIDPSDLKCPREQSFMTPCLARDGHLALCHDSSGEPICVGCEANLNELLRYERELQHGQ